MRKNDWILLAAICAAAAIFLGIQPFSSSADGNGEVEIYIDGELCGTYPLQEDRYIMISESSCTDYAREDPERARKIEKDATNCLEISDGKAQMTWADCRDQICVDHRSISREGESIICLPNKVTISISGGEESELDSVTN